jgi:ABC-type Zn2+ transport system substrate-binding protein/surface adhesin
MSNVDLLLGSQTISVLGGGIDEYKSLTKFAHKVTQMEHKLTNDVHALLDSSLYVFINLYNYTTFSYTVASCV